MAKLWLRIRSNSSFFQWLKAVLKLNSCLKKAWNTKPCCCIGPCFVLASNVSRVWEQVEFVNQLFSRSNSRSGIFICGVKFEFGEKIRVQSARVQVHWCLLSWVWFHHWFNVEVSLMVKVRTGTAALGVKWMRIWHLCQRSWNHCFEVEMVRAKFLSINQSKDS